MLQLYEVDPAHAEYLTQLAQQAREPGWWADYRDAVPAWFTEYVGLESAASAVCSYEQEYVPGLLQTRAYTFARVRVTRQERLSGEAP